jgi:UDP-N-acetylglucosamine diphosphorylase / glucose-1-phosphate thymidylyltransferase / UDP-N-acetylgalactosamine diphosphorylase / glucosamine-1-phosphate N-acetyltransferase / galactosamine-1-phosphate N-acetyltransferase
MTRLDATVFFDLEGFQHRDLFAPDAGVWCALGDRLKAYIASRSSWAISSPIPAGVHLLGDRIAIAPGCHIEPGAVIVGPAILEEGVVVRTGAYVREYVLLASGSLVGAHSEVKGAILFPGAKAPHQAYVGDSILGRDVNLGAGTICSNVKNVPGSVSLRVAGEVIDTGLRKLGAIVGDGCKTGCNTVLNPGVLLGPGSVTYPNATLRSGYYPRRTLVKVRQQQQLLELDRLL